MDETMANKKTNKDLQAEIDELNEQLQQKTAEIDELKDQLLRKIAEFDNYRKRTLKEKAELILNGGEKTVSAILPVVDDMERALAGMSQFEDVAAVLRQKTQTSMWTYMKP